MMNKRLVILVVVCAVLFLLLYVSFSGITGFSIFLDSGTGFNNGTYSGTSFNGSAVAISGTNLSGNYTSQIFDAGILSDWKNVSVSFSEPSADYLFAVDSSAGVFYSSDNGTSWSTRTSDYGGGGGSTVDMFSDGVRLYTLFSGTQKNVYRSDDFGLSWNSTAGNLGTPGLEYGESDSSGNLYILRTNGEVIKSTDLGVSWSTIGDINGAGSSSSPKGIAINSGGELFAVDANAIVWKSTNNGVNWTQKNASYIGGGGAAGTDDMAINFDSNIYILFNKQVYKSTNDGVSWSVVNNSFTPYASDGVRMSAYNDVLYIADASGRVFSSTNNGVNWGEVGDINGAGSANNPKGLTSLSARSDVTYQARNCSSSDCSGADFIGSDGSSASYFTSSFSSFNLRGRYFQYKTYMSRNSSLIAPYFDSVSVGYEVAASIPVVNITYPSNGIVLGTNNSIGLNFSASSSSGIGACWYTLNAGVNNVSIASCGNTTFGVNGSGSYSLIVYANESLAGVVGNSSTSFSVVLGAPLVSLNSPANNSYFNRSNLVFNYTASDIDLNTCALSVYYSNGSLAHYNSVKQTTSVSSAVFNASLNESSYSWFVSCDDGVGDIGISENRTLHVDLTNPSVSISAPTGAYTSLNSVPLTFSVVDNSPTLCYYNLTYLSTGGLVSGFSNLNIASCENISFNVVDETNYVLHLSVNDSAGNLGNASASFSVDVPDGTSGGSTGGSTGGSSGGGGGGGGGGSALFGVAKVSFISLEKIQLRQGESDEFSVQVLNSGARFLNKCSLGAEGGISPWIVPNNNEVASLSSGQRLEYHFNVNVPRDTRAGDYSANLFVSCNETRGEGSMDIEIISADFNFKMDRYDRVDANTLRVYYTLESFLDSSQSIKMKYSLLNSEGNSLANDEKFVSLGAKANQGFSLDIALPKDSFGEFLLEFDLSTEKDNALVRESVALSQSGITGFFISNENRDSLLKFGGVIVGLIVIFILFRLFYRRKILKGKVKARKRR